MPLDLSNEYLTPHFKRGEFTFSETAIRREIQNQPNLAQWSNLRVLAETCLEPARMVLGGIRISSGYRSPGLNTAIGGAANSQHTQGEAADIIPIETTLPKLFIWLYKNAPFDQIIWEFGQWVHVSHTRVATQRGQALLAYKKNGATVYAPITEEHMESL